MKKLFILVILLLLPITVFAKTPNKEETFKIINNISNVLVGEDIKIESTTSDDNNIIFTINGEEIKIPYVFSDNKLSFAGGSFTVDDNKKIIGNINDNDYAFYLYSILESKSTIPYDEDNYYNNETIMNKVNSNLQDIYKEETNTFGITLVEESTNKYNIIYDYYLDGDYPVLELEKTTEEFTNPETGNYNLLITIMLIAVVCVGVYTVVDPKKSN